LMWDNFCRRTCDWWSCQNVRYKRLDWMSGYI